MESRVYPSPETISILTIDITHHKQAQTCLPNQLLAGQEIREHFPGEQSLNSADQPIFKVLDSITDAFIVFDHEWRYTYVNCEAARMLQRSPEELVGKRWQDAFYEATYPHPLIDQELRRAVADQVTVEFESFSLAAQRWLEISAFPFPGGLAVYLRDISDRKQEERRKAARFAVTHVLAEATTLAEAVPAILQALCENLEWQLGMIWSVDQQDNVLRYVNSWRSPSADLQEFVAVSQQSTFAPGVGLLGQIWSTRQPIWIANFGEERHFPRSAVAAGKLHTVLGFPIALGQEILGVIECFSDRSQNPDVDLLQMMADIGSQIGQFVERKRTEAALRESQELFTSFMDNSPTSAFIKDENGRHVYVNAPVERLFQQRQVEIIGKTDFDLFSPEIAEQLQTNDAAVIASGQPLQIVETILMEGGVRYFMSCKFPFRNTSGQLFVAGMAIDISDRIRTEQALRSSEERLALASQAAKIGTFEWNIQTNQIFWSEEEEALYGLPPGSFGGTFEHWQQAVHPDDRDRTVQAVLQSIADGTDLHTEFRVVWPDGNLHWLAAKGRVYYDSEGHPLRMIGVNEEITARKQAEQERERLLELERSARQEAEAANRIKDEFLAVLSHELRSPLNPILGWTQLLRTRKFDQETHNRALETIERNAKIQTQLIEDLLDISRILRGKMALTVVPVDLATTLEAAIETVRLAAESKEITIQTCFDSTVGSVSGDAARLQQVAWNLLSNAVKFTPHGGQVTVKLSQVGASAQIQVSDNGKGINPDFLPYVFEYFRQEDGKITRKFGGLGLGLSIVRHLVELHGGTVQAESSGEDQGATFTVKLPLAAIAPPTQPQKPSIPSSIDLSQLRILVVDDEADMQELILTILQQYGAEVRSATSAAEAFTLLNQFQPDLLISDIGMPEIDGYKFMREVRRRLAKQSSSLNAPYSESEILAIALTGYAGEINQRQALAAGFQRHLSKPIEPET